MKKLQIFFPQQRTDKGVKHEQCIVIDARSEVVSIGSHKLERSILLTNVKEIRFSRCERTMKCNSINCLIRSSVV